MGTFFLLSSYTCMDLEHLLVLQVLETKLGTWNWLTHQSHSHNRLDPLIHQYFYMVPQSRAVSLNTPFKYFFFSAEEVQGWSTYFLTMDWRCSFNLRSLNVGQPDSFVDLMIFTRKFSADRILSSSKWSVAKLSSKSLCSFNAFSIEPLVPTFSTVLQPVKLWVAERLLITPLLRCKRMLSNKTFLIQ